MDEEVWLTHVCSISRKDTVEDKWQLEEVPVIFADYSLNEDISLCHLVNFSIRNDLLNVIMHSQSSRFDYHGVYVDYL